jgi:predicted transglutaminase-like cysteine proteinase
MNESKKPKTNPIVATALSAFLASAALAEQPKSNSWAAQEVTQMQSTDTAEFDKFVRQIKTEKQYSLMLGQEYLPPKAYVEMCRRVLSIMNIFCQKHVPNVDARLPLNSATLKLLKTVNDYVNNNMEFVADPYGTDYWDHVESPLKGDCEEAVMYKYRIALKLGVPQEVLSLGIVNYRNPTTKKPEGHLVLVVNVNLEGKDGKMESKPIPLILDSLFSDIKTLGQATHLEFVAITDKTRTTFRDAFYAEY